MMFYQKEKKKKVEEVIPLLLTKEKKMGNRKTITYLAGGRERWLGKKLLRGQLENTYFPLFYATSERNNAILREFNSVIGLFIYVLNTNCRNMFGI